MSRSPLTALSSLLHNIQLFILRAEPSRVPHLGTRTSTVCTCRQILHPDVIIKTFCFSICMVVWRLADQFISVLIDLYLKPISKYEMKILRLPIDRNSSCDQTLLATAVTTSCRYLPVSIRSKLKLISIKLLNYPPVVVYRAVLFDL